MGAGDVLATFGTPRPFARIDHRRKVSEVRSELTSTRPDSSATHPESLAAQEFANTALGAATPGFHADCETPAMATPATPTAAQFVIQGSTICLVC
nr:SinA [Streptomyces sp.]